MEGGSDRYVLLIYHVCSMCLKLGVQLLEFEFYLDKILSRFSGVCAGLSNALDWAIGRCSKGKVYSVV